MRIIEDKVAKRNLSDEEADIVRKSAKILFDKLCTTNSVIAFIPIKLLMESYVLKSGVLYKILDGIPEMDYARETGKTLYDYLCKQKYFNAETK